MIPITQSYTNTDRNGVVTIYPKSAFEFVIINDAFSLSSKYIKFKLELKSLITGVRTTLTTVEFKEGGTQNGYTNQADYDTWVQNLQDKNDELTADMTAISVKYTAKSDESAKETPDQDVLDALQAEIDALNTNITNTTMEINDLSANPVELVPNMVDKFDDFFSNCIDNYDVTPVGAAMLAAKAGVSIT